MQEVETLKEQKRDAEASYRNSMPRNDFSPTSSDNHHYFHLNKRCIKSSKVHFYSSNASESVKSVPLTSRISKDFMTTISDWPITTAENFISVSLI